MQDLTVTESNIKLNVSIREWIKWTQTYTHFQYLLLFTLRHLHICEIKNEQISVSLTVTIEKKNILHTHYLEAVLHCMTTF